MGLEKMYYMGKEQGLEVLDGELRASLLPKMVGQPHTIVEQITTLCQFVVDFFKVNSKVPFFQLIKVAESKTQDLQVIKL